MTFTTNQWAILALVLLLGWVLGLASRSGGRRWKAELAQERERRRAVETRLEAAQARIAELERTRVVETTPVIPVVPATPVVAPDETATTTRPYSPNG